MALRRKKKQGKDGKRPGWFRRQTKRVRRVIVWCVLLVVGLAAAAVFYAIGQSKPQTLDSPLNNGQKVTSVEITCKKVSDARLDCTLPKQVEGTPLSDNALVVEYRKDGVNRYRIAESTADAVISWTCRADAHTLKNRTQVPAQSETTLDDGTPVVNRQCWISTMVQTLR